MIDLTKLKSVVKKGDKIVAQCPACAAVGADNNGDHLVVFVDGKFGCVKHEGDKDHNKEILKLVGKRGAVLPPSPTLEIRRQTIPESSVLLQIGRLGRQKPTPDQDSTEKPGEPEKTFPPDDEPMVAPDPELTSSDEPARTGGIEDPTIDEVWEFLGKKVS